MGTGAALRGTSPAQGLILPWRWQGHGVAWVSPGGMSPRGPQWAATEPGRGCRVSPSGKERMRSWMSAARAASCTSSSVACTRP